METKEQLSAALKDAMRAGDELRKRTIRQTLAAIKQVEIDKRLTLDEAGVLAVIQKEVKSRHEALADAERAHRPDLVMAARDEIAVLETFLPKALAPEELETLARQAIAEVGATSPREMGQVMKALMPRLQGRATGDQASQAVRKFLQA
jgi:uncharacterized protein YqeY